MRFSKIVSLSLLAWATSIYALPAEPVLVPHPSEGGGGRPSHPTTEGDPTTPDNPPPPPTGDDNTGDNSGVEGGNWQVPSETEPNHVQPPPNAGHTDELVEPPVPAGEKESGEEGSAVRTVCKRRVGSACRTADGILSYEPPTNGDVRNFVNKVRSYTPGVANQARAAAFELLRPYLVNNAPKAGHGIAYIGAAGDSTEVLAEHGFAENVGLAYGNYGWGIFDKNQEPFRSIIAAGLMRRFFEVTSDYYMSIQKGEMVCLADYNVDTGAWYMQHGYPYTPDSPPVIFDSAELFSLKNNDEIEGVYVLRKEAVDTERRNGVTALVYPITDDHNPLTTPGRMLIWPGKTPDWWTTKYKGARLMPRPEDLSDFNEGVQSYLKAHGGDPPDVIFSSWDKWYPDFAAGRPYKPDVPLTYYRTPWRYNMHTEANQPIRNGQNWDNSEQIPVDIFDHTPPGSSPSSTGNSRHKRQTWNFDHAPLAIAAY